MENSTLCQNDKEKNEWSREREGGRGVILPIAAKIINETQSVSSKSGKPKSTNKRHFEK